MRIPAMIKLLVLTCLATTLLVPAQKTHPAPTPHPPPAPRPPRPSPGPRPAPIPKPTPGPRPTPGPKNPPTIPRQPPKVALTQPSRAAVLPAASAGGVSGGHSEVVTHITAFGYAVNPIEGFADFDSRQAAIRALHAQCTGFATVTTVAPIACWQLPDTNTECESQANGICRIP